MEQYELQHLQSMRTGNIIQSKMDIDDIMRKYLARTREEIEQEISKRLQLTLDFDQEPEDGAYAD